MGLIAEFEADAPFGQEGMARAPSTTLVREETDLTPDGRLRVVCRATGDDLDAFEAGLAADESVAALTTLTATDDCRVYALRLAARGDETAYATLVACGGQLLALEHDRDGVHARVRLPSREAYVELKEAWEERYGAFLTVGLYTEHGSDGLTLTPKQREALAVALDRGYFDVPRRSTLAEVAADLGISDTAASERIRRGCRELVRAAAPATAAGHQNG
jgi:predicted DNA binding protein